MAIIKNNIFKYTWVKYTIGAFLVGSGVLMAFALPYMVKVLALELKIKLDRDSSTYKEGWSKVYFRQEIFMFNVTNAWDVETLGAKAIVEEVGPITYIGQLIKHKTKFHGKNRVAYNPLKTYKFSAKLSKFPEDAVITTINAPLVSALIKFRDNPMAIAVLKNFLELTGAEKLFVQKTAKELLFEGYPDMFVSASNLMKDSPNYSEGKFGFLKLDNHTLGPRVVSYTGKHDVDLMNTVIAINNETKLSYWENGTHCNSFKGAVEDFSLRPPVDDDDQKVIKLLFLPACRVLKYRVQEEDDMYLHDWTLDMKRFKIEPSNFMNGLDHEPNSCYDVYSDALRTFYRRQDDGRLVLPSGAMDVSKCNQNAPILFSQPHFLGADDFYRFGVEGLRPDKRRHSSQMVISPKVGVTLRFDMFWQINLAVDVRAINEKIKPVVFPVLYFGVHTEIPRSSAKKLWVGTRLADALGYATCGFCALVGLIMIGLTYYFSQEVGFRSGGRTSLDIPSFSETGTFRMESKL